jgi:uncharacterized protein YceK
MKNGTNKLLLCILLLLYLSGCGTTVAVLDVTATTAIYAGKTVVNTIDAITPDIVNGKD